MWAYKESVLVNSPSNVVQEVYQNRKGEEHGISVEELNIAFLSGQEIDYDKIDYSKEEVSYMMHGKKKWKSWVRTSSLSSEDLVRLQEEIETECNKALGYKHEHGEGGHGSKPSPYELSMGQSPSEEQLLKIRNFESGDSFRDG